MDFLGLSTITTGVIIIVISLFNFRHSSGSKSMSAIRAEMSDEQISKLSKMRPTRGVAVLGVYFGLFIVAAGVIEIAIIKWMWWGI